ncbi:MAG TPA: Smr/MutS family protein [Thermoanaerobaculaceae bacterium]|nr:Smr/MutS family protein [Thermoanaerobaculaceae bacterium]HPS76817.1 Smr/MutS family protein [Thermoanaerobaculaceae bacterium]
MGFASLEFDRVLALVAAFARSQRGAATVRATRPRFGDGGSRDFLLANDLAALGRQGVTLGFAGLDAADALGASTTTSGDPSTLTYLVSLLRRIGEARATLLATACGPELTRLAAALPAVEHLLAYCDQRLGPDGEVLDTASPQLAQARAGRERHRHAIIDVLEEERRKHRFLQAPFTLRRDRYCLPVPVHERQAVPGLVLDVSATAATVFVEPFAAVELNNALAEAIAMARAAEEQALAEVAAVFARHGEELRLAADALAEMDAFQARVLFGQAAGGMLLVPGGGRTVQLWDARHPLLDPALATLRERVLGEPGSTRPIVPLNLTFPELSRLVLLSGPNAGGKTVALKTIGLCALMVQCGIPVLAAEGSGLPPLSGVWCHIGDEQNLLSDLSTFTGAMRATADLLRDANEDTLVLYDELGSGTDPEEGAALAAALLEELARRRCWMVATAHLLTVAAHLEGLVGAANAAMGFDEASGRPTFELTLGVPGRSRGLAIAAASGVPASVTARARSLLSQSFLAIDTYLATLQHERDRLGEEQQALQVLQAEARQAEERAAEARAAFFAEREKVKVTLAEERERLRSRAAQRLQAALAELEEARQRGEMPGKRRLTTIRYQALNLQDEQGPMAAPAPGLAPGVTVRVASSAMTGVVNKMAGNRVEVQVGSKRLWVEAGTCQVVGGKPARSVATSLAADEEPVPAELKLLGLTQEDARADLERFLDHAVLTGQRHVRVVHGHGTGTLRRMVLEVLKGHPAVVRFSHPPQNRGGTGATEAELE